MIPGSNLLNMALSVIAQQPMTYYRNTGRTLSVNGLYVPSYAPGITVSGSFQPVPRNMYEAMGLEFQKNYVNIFISRSVIDINRAVSGDKFKYCGKIYLAESKTAWSAVDGWDQVLCVEVPANV